MSGTPFAFALVIMLCASVTRVEAAIGTIDASQEGVFTHDRCSVIVAKVDRVWREKSNLPADDRMQEKAVLSPLATIAGELDPSLHPTITVEFYAGAPTTSIKAVPSESATVLAVVRHQVLVHDDPKPRNVIESANCLFMPERSAMVIIKGLDDPAVQQTLVRIQEGRAKRAAIERRSNPPRPAAKSNDK